MRSGGGVAASDLIRSMKHLGFGRDEIYDVLVGVGLPGEQVQLLIDRVSAEFYEAKLEPQPSRLAKEVREIFESQLEGVRHELLTRIDSLYHKSELVEVELEKLGKRVLELQSIAVKIQRAVSLRRVGPSA